MNAFTQSGGLTSSKARTYILVQSCREIRSPAEDVLGSTGNVYQVELHSSGNACSCLDFAKGGGVCKHILFLMLRVLKLPRDDHRVYQTGLTGSASWLHSYPELASRQASRLLEFCPTSTTGALVDELFMELPSLCSHNFAHHVIESVLENGNAKHKSQVVQELLKEPWKYATHKNSSYIVEKALRHCDPSEEKALIKALGQPHQIFDLARTQFGCYVARALLQDSRVDAEAAMNIIKMHRSHLEQTTPGQRFLADVGLGPEAPEC
eukprot:Skav219202  [mRNA]  locus=scaffold537:50062:53657:+ [translate_table: standard]